MLCELDSVPLLSASFHHQPSHYVLVCVHILLLHLPIPAFISVHIYLNKVSDPSEAMWADTQLHLQKEYLRY
jgi:hypothetical protein